MGRQEDARRVRKLGPGLLVPSRPRPGSILGHRWVSALLLASLGWACLGVLSCAPPVRGTQHPSLYQSGDPVDSIAIVPFSRPLGRAGDPQLDEGAALVERFLAEALAARGVKTIPAADVATAARAAGMDPTKPVSPREFAQLCAAEFGVAAILTGEMRRYVERIGEALGARQPASVAFDVALHSAPRGGRMWSAVFDETQKSMTENVLRARRYPGGGTRWLSGPEFAKWAASEIVNEAPVSAGP